MTTNQSRLLRTAQQTIDEIIRRSTALKEDMPGDGQVAWARVLRLQSAIGNDVATFLGDCLEESKGK